MRVADTDNQTGAAARALDQNRLLYSRWWIGEWLVDFASGRIILGDSYRKLTLKACGVLRELVSASGQPVTRDALLSKVWCGTIPTDDVLSQAISELRKAMRDDPRNARYIETITKVGYRLMADIRPAAPVPADQLQPAPAATEHWSGASKWFVFGVVAAAAALAAILAMRGPTAQDQLQVTDIAGLGGHVNPVSSDPGLEHYPSISPDGLGTVYSARPLGSTSFDLFVKSHGAYEARQLTNNPEVSDYMATWSPDGTRIAFLRLGPGDCGISVVSAMGGFARRVGTCTPGTVSFLDWSPDGQYLVYPEFSDQFPDSVHLHRINLATETSAPLVYAVDPDEHDISPRYSPDGKWIAFRRGAFPYSSLYLTSANGGPVRELAKLNATIYGMDWLSDSSGLIYSSNHLGQDAVLALDLETLESTVIDWRAAHGLALSMDDTLIWSTNSSVRNLWEYALDGSGSHLDHFLSTRNEHSAAYSPDGRSIAFISDRGGTEQIWYGDLSLNAARRISDIRDGIPKSPRWSPDSRQVVYSVQLRDEVTVQLSNVATGENQTILRDIPGLGDVAIASNGLDLVYSVNQADGWHLWRRALDSSDVPQLLTRGSARTPRTSPVDDFIYYTRPHGSGLWRVPAAGGAEEQVTDQFRFRSRRGWTIAADGIYFMNYRNRQAAIERLDWGASEPVVVTLIDGTVSAANLAIHPLGTHALLTRHGNRGADILEARGWRSTRAD